MSNVYYVYALLDPRKPGPFKYGKWIFSHEPFYVGKGKEDRANRHYRDFVNKVKSQLAHNKPKTKRLEHIHRETRGGPIVVYKRENLSDAEAYILEEKLIASVKRVRYGGPLLNLAAGGKVGCSDIRKPLSETTKAKMSASIKETFAGKDNDYWEDRAEKVSAAWKSKDPNESAKISEKNRDTANKRWSGQDGEKLRSEHSSRMGEVNARRLATEDPMTKAKNVFKMRIGYSLNRLSVSDKKKAQIKASLYEFLSNARHKCPTRFAKASKAKMLSFGLCG